MAKYIVIRIVWMMLLLLLIMTVVYFLASITMLRHWSSPPHNLLDQFVFTFHRYTDYLHGIINDWNWGRTPIYDAAVWDHAWIRMRTTLFINLVAFGIAIPIGILLGFVSAMRRHGAFDRVVSVLTMVLGSIPHFILMYLLIVLLAIRWRLFPMNFPGIHGPPSRWLIGLAIPLIALALPVIFKFTRLIRGEFIEARGDDYLLLCKTKGMSEQLALRRHAFRNCLVPMMPELTPTFLYVLGGSFFVELIYGIDGVAKLMYDSMIHPMMDFSYIRIDIPMAMMTTVFYAFIGLFVALCIDIAYPLLDPRMRIGVKHTEAMQ